MRRKSRIRSIIKSEFLRNTSKLITGTTIAQLIPILLQPFLRRFYSAEVFGAYAVYLGLIGIFYAITSLRYEQAIIHSEDEKEANAIFWVAQVSNLAISIIFLLLILLLKNNILLFLNLDSGFATFILLVPAGIFFFNLQQSMNLWLIRKKNFGTVSKMKIVRRVVEGSLQLGIKNLSTSSGLLFGDLCGHFANVFYGGVRSVRKGFQLKVPKLYVLKSTFRKYSEYPKYNALTSFLNAFGIMVPVIIINKFYGTESAGYFDLARLLLLTPAALLAGALANVMLQRISDRRKHSQGVGREFALILSIGISIVLIELLVLHTIGEELFVVLFGEEWKLSSSISKILIWPYAGLFFTIAFSSTFIALQKIKFLSLYQFANFILIISILFFTHLKFQVFLKIFAVLSIISTMFFFLLLFFAFRTHEREVHSFKKDIDPK